MDGLRDFLHEFSIHTKVHETADQRATAGPNQEPGHRKHKHAEHQAQQGTNAGRRHRALADVILDVNLAVRVFTDDCRILE